MFATFTFITGLLALCTLRDHKPSGKLVKGEDGIYRYKKGLEKKFDEKKLGEVEHIALEAAVKSRIKEKEKKI